MMSSLGNKTASLLVRGYGEVHQGVHHVLEALFINLNCLLQNISQSVNQAWQIWLQNLLPQFVQLLRYTINRTTEQMQQTPLTIKACLVMVVLALIITGILCLRKRKKVSLIPDESTILNVFDLAKTAYEPGHVNALIELVNKRSFDINYPLPNSGLSLFLCACLSGQRKLIQFLLKKGAMAQQKTHDGDSALYLATFGAMSLQTPEKDITGLINDLIEAGCDVNEQNNKGYTALHRGASKGNIVVIKCLLKHGANPYLTTNTGIYPIDLATNAGHLEAAELLTIELQNPYVWDVVEPHTPSKIRLGLMSPRRKHLAESTRKQTTKFRNSY